FTDQVLGSLHVQKAFIGTPALHAEHGLTHPEAQLVMTKQKMIKAAREVFIVTDDTKIGKVSLHTVAPIHSVNNVITGSEVPEAQVKLMEEKGVKVIRA